MAQNNIFILDAEQEQADLLSAQLSEYEYEAKSFGSLDALVLQLEAEAPALCLLEYSTLLEMQRQEVILLFQKVNQFEIAVYNVPQDATRRLAFYELGARRVYDSGHSPEELSYSIRWLMQAISTGDMQQAGYAHGDLNDISLETLIPLLSSEQRTGILTVHSEKGSGKIYFANGNILDAQTGAHRAELAFYQLLLWNSGKFLFLSRPEMQLKNRIMLSNYGLLLKGRQYKQKYESLLKDLAPSGSVIRATRLGDLKMSDLQINPEFVKLIGRPHSLEELIENSYYTANETLENLVILKSYGYLIINAPVVQTTQETDIDPQMIANPVQWQKQELEQFCRDLNIAGKTEAKIVVLSWGREKRNELLSELGGVVKSRGHAQNIDVSRMSINKSLDLFLLGLELNQTASESIARMDQSLAGFIFIIDADAQDQFEYTNYVVNQILTTHPLAAVVAVDHLKDGQETEKVREQFLTPSRLTWIPKPKRAKDLLLSVSPFEYDEEEPEADESEESTDSETTEVESDAGLSSGEDEAEE